jgi:hypothetical protein
VSNVPNLVTFAYVTIRGESIEVPNQNAVIRMPRPQPYGYVTTMSVPSGERPTLGQIWPRGVVESGA